MRQKHRSYPKNVAILIVTYNGAPFIQRCILSLQKQTYPSEYFSIIVVDNASTDTTIAIVEKLKQLHENITLIKSDRNGGFGAANNIGIKKVGDVDYIALLNQDSWIEKGWLRELVDTMEKNPRAGCCGAAEHPYDRTLAISKEQRTSTQAGCWMGGGSVIFRKKALDSIGLFDEIYFMYGEDIDLTWRLQLAGFSILKNNNAIWHHEGRKRCDETTEWRVYYSWRNRIFILIKFGSIQQVCLSLVSYCNYLVMGNKKKREENGCVEKTEKIDKRSELSMRKVSPLTKGKAIAKKLLFSARLACAVIWYLPKIVLRRMSLNKQGIDYMRTDAWIRETDRQLYGI